MKKKLLSFLLAFVMVISLLPATALAATESVTIYLSGYAVHDEDQTVAVTVDGNTYTFDTSDIDYSRQSGYYVQIEVEDPAGKNVTAVIAGASGETLVQDTSTISRRQRSYQATVQLAIWSYTITFDANGGVLPEGVSATIKQDGITETAETVDLTDYVPTHENENYTFAGWKASGSDHVYTRSYTVAEPSRTTEVSVTLTAQWSWTGDWTYELVYDANTNDTVTGMPDPSTVTQNSNIFTLSTTAPVREGYHFLGWSTVANNDYYIISSESITLYTDGVYNTNTVSETLYAMWDEINTTTYNWNVASLSPKSSGGGYDLGVASGSVNTTSNVTVYTSNNHSTWTQISALENTTARYIKIVPASGYYVQYLVVACNDNDGVEGDYGLGCNSVGNGSAYTDSFDPTSGAVILDTSIGDFAHQGRGAPYHVLIQLATMPNPVYVVYDAGEAAAAFGEDKLVVASTGAYATDSTDGSVAFRYDTRGPEHTVLEITDEEVTANNYTYTFTGWELEYFSSVSGETVNGSAAVPTLGVSLAGTYGTSNPSAGSEITLYTYAKLTAQWTMTAGIVEEPELTVTKVLTKINDSAYTSGSVEVGDVLVWTITVSNTGNVDLTDISVSDALAQKGFVSLGSLDLYADEACQGETVSTISSLTKDGDSQTLYATYTVESMDAGRTLVNTVTAQEGNTSNSDSSEVLVKGQYTLTVEFYLERISEQTKFTDFDQAKTNPATPATLSSGDGYAIWVLQNGNQVGYTNFKAPATLTYNNTNYVFNPVATTDPQHGNISGDTTVRLVYSVDEIGEENPEEPDNIPDKYQVTVVYASANEAYGTVSPTKEVLTIYADAANTIYAQTGDVAIGGSKATANTNYVFKHWVDYEHKEMLNQNEELSDVTIENAVGGSAYTFTAHWDTDPDSLHNIIYHYGTGYPHIAGADMPVDTETYQNGYEVKTSDLKSLPTAKEYVFDGWYLDAACTNAKRFDLQTNPVVINNGNLVLYAKYFAVADLVVTKEVTSVGGKAYTSNTVAKLGDEIVWTIAVENTGELSTSVGLPADVLKDADGNTIANLTVVLDTANTPALLSDDGVAPQAEASYQVPGESTIYFTATYVVTEEDLGKTLVNVVSVDDESPEEAPGVEVESADPSLSITKQVAMVGGVPADYSKTPAVIPYADKGDTIVWNIIVENTGNTTLANVLVTDSLATATDGVIDTITTLAPGAKETISFAYTVTEADETARRVNNSATATAGTLTDTDTSEVQVNNPDLTVVKTVEKVLDAENDPKADKTVAATGDTIIWKIVVTNTGNTKLEGIKIAELLSGAELYTDEACTQTFANTGFDLESNGSERIYAKYTVKDTDAGKSVVNIAEATANDGTDSEDSSDPVKINAKLIVKYYLEDENGNRTAYGDPVTETLAPGARWSVVIGGTGDQSTHNAPENISITTGEGTDAVTANYAFDPPASTKVLSGTISGDVTVELVYAIDVVGGEIEPHGGDEDPDKYQVTICYVVKDETTGEIIGKTEEVLTILNGSAYAETGTIRATGSVAQAKDGYIFDKWTIQYNNNPEYDTTFTADCTDGQIGARTANGGDVFVFTAYFKGKNTAVEVKKTVASISAPDGTPYSTLTGAKVGDTITWTITVTNKGNVTQTLDLTDKLTNGSSVALKDASGNTVTEVTLTPHQTVTYTATYTTVLSDAGKTLLNTAVVSSDDGETKGDSEPVSVKPAVEVIKTANKSKVDMGDRVTYTITVKNTGNEVLTGIRVVDEMLGVSETVDLAVGASWSKDYTYRTTAKDVGNLRNVVVVEDNEGNELGQDDVTTKVERSDVPSVDPDPKPPKLNKEDHFAYIIGKDDGLVHPLDHITRAETATIFFRMLLEESRQYYWTQENDFVDVTITDWFNNAASTLNNAGVMTGRPGNQFAPYANITRGEFATLAVRFFLDEDVEITENNLSDVKGHWAEANINLAYALGLITGYPDHTFRPDQEITRAEAMVIVNRVLERHPHKDHLLSYMITWPDNMDPRVWYYADVQEATNSHVYVMMTDQNGDKYELWQKLLPVRDWAALEKEWSEYNSSHNPGEVVDVTK